ncbi:MAG TPA: class I lanthipeptide [Chitinophaga sp.]|uniref:class I lanthipeptide n=1 Tax=Chitinophaga sp. TaxID=1869181 RepID=UPI002B6CA73B|nr:class I lanthipeptide [Chitinophaga sp.]HVI48711.1 class I lanthipeptide [Chitinophaga sp.]
MKKKTIHLDKKLSLQKHVVSELTTQEKVQLKGAGGDTVGFDQTCLSYCVATSPVWGGVCCNIF